MLPILLTIFIRGDVIRQKFVKTLFFEDFEITHKINAKNQEITYLSVWQKFLPRLGPLYPQNCRPTSQLSNKTGFVFLSRLDQKL